MYNASDRKDIRRAEKAEKAATSERVAFLKFAMSTPNGRSWFHDILTRTHNFHVLPPSNPLIREFEQGERNIGVQIYNDLISHCPDLYLLMLHEAQTRELSNARSEPDLYSDSPSRELPGSPTSNGGDPGLASTGDDPDDGGWGNLIGLGDE